MLLDIHPQRLMIHVKQQELLPEKKKQKGKRKAVENILRYVEPNDSQNEVEEDEDDGLDVFQNNIGISLREHNINFHLSVIFLNYNYCLNIIDGNN